MEHWNADGRINSGNDQNTPGINLVDQYILGSRESTVYNRRQSALGLVYLHSLGGSTVMFRYYLLGGDTAAPSGLYTRLCHVFLVLIFFCFRAMTLQSAVAFTLGCKLGSLITINRKMANNF